MKKLINKVSRILSESKTGRVLMVIHLKKFNVPKVFGLIQILMILFCWSCQSNKEGALDDHRNGIVPSSIEQVVDVFELKYGEVKDITCNGKLLRFSITDVEDKFMLISGTSYIPPEVADKSRTNAFLRVEIGKNVFHIKVSSQKLGGLYEYMNDGLDIQHIWSLLEEWQSLNEDFPNGFGSTFWSHFDDGTLITKTQFGIFMAKAYPFAYKMNDKPEKSMYKFIFIITK